MNVGRQEGCKEERKDGRMEGRKIESNEEKLEWMNNLLQRNEERGTNKGKPATSSRAFLIIS